MEFLRTRNMNKTHLNVFQRLNWYTFLWALIVILILLSSSSFQVGSFSDDALYINVACAFATGAGYVDLPLVGNPPHTFVPPVYPVLLTPLLLIFPYDWLVSNNFIPMQLLSFLMTVAAMYGFSKLVTKGGYANAIGILALVFFNSLIIATGFQVMSEAPFLLFSILACLFFFHWEEGNRQNERTFWLAISFAIMATMTRLIGVTLLMGITIYLVPRVSRKKWILSNIALYLPFVGWTFRNIILGQGAAGSYTTLLKPEGITQFVSVIARNIDQMVFTNLPETIFPLLFGPKITTIFERLALPWIPKVIGLFILLIIFTGYFYQWKARKNTKAILLYVPIYFGSLLFVNFAIDGGIRYILPVFPFIILFFVEGLWRIFQRIFIFKGTYNNLGFLAFKAILIGLCLLYLGRDLQGIVDPNRKRIPDISLGTSWLYALSPEDSIVMAGYNRQVYLYSHRKVVEFPSGMKSDEEFLDNIYCKKTDYVLIQPKQVAGLPFDWENSIKIEIMPAIERNKDYFKLIYEGQDGLVLLYEFLQSKYDQSPDCGAIDW